MSSATSAHSGMPVLGPGSRSNTHIVGDSMSAPRAIGAWISSAAMLADHASAATESRAQYPMVPLRSPGPSNVPIHSGRCDGQRFSKNDVSSTPLGYRRSVTPAVGDVRQHHRRDADVVVDDLGLGEPRRRVQHLVEVGDLELAPVDLDELVGH